MFTKEAPRLSVATCVLPVKYHALECRRGVLWLRSISVTLSYFETFFLWEWDEINTHFILSL